MRSEMTSEQPLRNARGALSPPFMHSDARDCPSIQSIQVPALKNQRKTEMSCAKNL